MVTVSYMQLYQKVMSHETCLMTQRDGECKLTGLCSAVSNKDLFINRVCETGESLKTKACYLLTMATVLTYCLLDYSKSLLGGVSCTKYTYHYSYLSFSSLEVLVGHLL